MEVVFLDGLSQTLAAELTASLQAVKGLKLKSRGTIAFKRVGKKRYVYIQRMVNGRYEYEYVGPEDAVDAERLKASLENAREIYRLEKDKQRKITRFLLGEGVVPVSGDALRFLKALGKEGALNKVVLVGTTAFLAYQVILGFVPCRAHSTLDVDIMRDGGLIKASQQILSLTSILENNGINCVLESPPDVPFPVRLRLPNLTVDLLYPKIGSRHYVPPPESGFSDVGAQAIPYARMLTEDTYPGVLLHRGEAFLVVVPHPVGFALHKAVSFLRRSHEQKNRKEKDAYQAKTVLAAFLKIHEREEVEDTCFRLIKASAVGKQFRPALERLFEKWLDETEEALKNVSGKKPHRRRSKRP